MFNISLPNFIGWLQQTLRKEQKLFSSSSFYLKSKLSETIKQHYEKKKKSQNIFYVILSVLAVRARSKIC